LLERLAWLAPEKIPDTLLEVDISRLEAPNTREAFDELSSYSLLTRDAEGPFFLVHRLVQDVTRRSLVGDARRRSLTEALNWVNAACDGLPSDVRNWPRLDPLMPHARAVTNCADIEGIPHPTSRLMNQLGVMLNAKALHSQAEPLMRRALAINEASYGPDHPEVAACLSNLAVLLHDTNRLAEAEPLMRRALAITETSRGADHPDLAIRLSNLAGLLQDTNRLAEAEALMRRALAIDEARDEPDHPEVATSLSNLAVLLHATNRLAEAEPLMRRALAMTEVSYGADHPFVAIRLNNLAQLLKNANRLVEAEPLMRRAFSIDEASYGPSHPLSRSASTTWPHYCKTPTGSPRPSRSFAGRLPSPRQATDQIIPMSQSASTTSPNCCKTPTGLPRPSHSCDVQSPYLLSSPAGVDTHIRISIKHLRTTLFCFRQWVRALQRSRQHLRSSNG
jgi:tetratricopeptide (TPR) repeat protein